MDPLFIVFLASLALFAVSCLGLMASVDISGSLIVLMLISGVSGVVAAVTGVWLILIGAGVL